MDYERLFLDNLGLVDQVVRGIAHRHRLSADETDELRDAIRLKLVENDYGVLRQFQQRCSLRTYLTTVVHRSFLDGRNARWGKWRPSLEARRQGATAVLLERLLTRDGLSFDQAVELLRTNHQVGESSEELYRMSLGFPERTPRRFVGDEALGTVAGDSVADEGLMEQESVARASATAQALATVLRALGPQDRLILKMRFQDNVQVSQIARLLKVDQKPLYRRIEQVLKVLRRALEEHGISREDVETITGTSAVEIDSVMGADVAGNVAARPSVR